MNCITSDLIQKYIDGETDLEESVLIRTHVANCEACGNRLRTQEKLATDVKEALNLLNQDIIGIPPMPVPLTLNRRRPVLRMKLSYALAAACVLLFLVLVLPTNRDLKQNEITMLQSFDEDYDANLPVSQQKMIISVVDPTGKVSEFYVD